MPFRSRAQMRKFREMVRRGEIDEATFQEWLDQTDVSALPEKIENKRNKHPNRRKQHRVNRRGIRRHLQQYKKKGYTYVTKSGRVIRKKT